MEEGNLRDMLELAAGEPPRWISLDSIRQRAVRRRVTQAGVAALAAALAVGLGATLSAYAARGGSPTTGGTKAPSGPPKFYIEDQYHRGGKTTVEVRSRTTGRVTSVVRNPLPRFRCGDNLAAGGTNTFFMTCPTWTKKPGAKHATITSTRIYQFEVSNSGRASFPTLVKGSILKGLDAEQLTASPDGSLVAVQVIPPNPNGTLYTDSMPSGIVVINTKTGKRAIWRVGPYVPGKIGYTSTRDISFTGNGSELVVLESRCHRTRYFENCQSSDAQEVRTLGPADRGGSLQGGQLLLRLSAFKAPRTSLPYAQITPDGTALTTVTETCPRGSFCTMTVQRIGVTGVKARQVLYQVTDKASVNGAYLEQFSTDPTGRFMIIVANTATTKEPVNGWIDHGRLVPLTPANGFAAGTEAW
ncbi:MAG TPA: hypothetical protein VFI65_09090 [Streptosporangiaceae bacterium]|nr:hypothetical protein [Streptosporangiaceae bacterium]